MKTRLNLGFYNKSLFSLYIKSSSLCLFKSSLSFLDNTMGKKNIRVNKMPHDIEAKSSPYANQPITVAGTIINKYNLELNDKLDDFIC